MTIKEFLELIIAPIILIVCFIIKLPFIIFPLLLLGVFLCFTPNTYLITNILTLITVCLSIYLTPKFGDSLELTKGSFQPFVFQLLVLIISCFVVGIFSSKRHHSIAHLATTIINGLLIISVGSWYLLYKLYNQAFWNLVIFSLIPLIFIAFVYLISKRPHTNLAIFSTIIVVILTYFVLSVFLIPSIPFLGENIIIHKFDIPISIIFTSTSIALTNSYLTRKNKSTVMSYLPGILPLIMLGFPLYISSLLIQF